MTSNAPPLAPSSTSIASLHASGARGSRSTSTDTLREHFTQFVGESFFGQMIKAMRSTVGKPAYFHGGRSEEVFQGQLDQRLAEHLTESSYHQFDDTIFSRQFPHLAAPASSSDLADLSQLPRR